jgi:hypothetical protein
MLGKVEFHSPLCAIVEELDGGLARYWVVWHLQGDVAYRCGFAPFVVN